MRVGIAVFVVIAIHCVVGANIYQLCGQINGDYAFLADELVKNFTDVPYSYQYNSSHTIYYNFCAGTSKCNGGILCMEGPAGQLLVVGSPGDDAYSSGNGLQMQFTYHPINGYVYYSIMCDSEQTELVKVQTVHLYSPNSFYMYFSSPSVCQSQPIDSNQSNPISHEYMSGEIYMVGNMPMWAFDYVASAKGQAVFEGNFYYSAADLSFKLNGTLANPNGQTSFVSMIVQGQARNQNPPIAVSTFQPSSDSDDTCALLPKLRTSGSLRWFQGSANMSNSNLDRSYESIYWDKGSSFEVEEYFNGSYFSVMQRVSDGATVALGSYYLAPFANNHHVTFVSEVKWDSLSYDPVPSSTFDIPAICKQ